MGVIQAEARAREDLFSTAESAFSADEPSAQRRMAIVRYLGVGDKGDGHLSTKNKNRRPVWLIHQELGHLYREDGGHALFDDDLDALVGQGICHWDSTESFLDGSTCRDDSLLWLDHISSWPESHRIRFGGWQFRGEHR